VKTVSRLSIAPVKGLALLHPDEIELGLRGAVGNRLFFLVDARDRKFDQIEHGPLGTIVSAYGAERDRLTLRFPDGSVVEDDVRVGEPVSGIFSHGRRRVGGRLVDGAFSGALSEFVGEPLRLVKADKPWQLLRARGPVTIVSDASLAELARQSGVDSVDGRRFRMLIDVGGCRPHEEDEWIDGDVRLGGALVRLREEVDRCAVTTQNPETGVPDLDTLRTVVAYRGVRVRRNKQRIDFGVFGEVLEPGAVRVGDPVELL
jgi:uncharacterized protein YcbX